MDLVAIAKAYDAAGNAHGIEAVLAFFIEDIVFRTGPPPLSAITTGKQQARSYLEGILPGFHLESWGYRASGEKMTWQSRWSSDRFRVMGIDYLESTTEATVEVNKIKSVVGTLSPQTIEKLWAVLE